MQKSIIAAPILAFVTFLLYQSASRFIDDSCMKVPLVKPVIYGAVEGKRLMPTQIFFDHVNKQRIVSDFANSRLVYAAFSKENWQEYNPEKLGQVHAVAYHPESRKYFAVDTSNNSIVSFDSLGNSKSEFSSFKQIGNIDLGLRPHDITYNYNDGFIYVLLNTGLLRFKPTNVYDEFENVELLTKSEIQTQLQTKYSDKYFRTGYMRALTIVNGEIFLINSTQGNVIRIPEFESPESWEIYFNKARNKKYAEKGSFAQHGLILNDVTYFDGWWYGSNYYASKASNYISDNSVSEFKLIRWKNWKDFENSIWQDLSIYVHPESIPYYLSKHENKLFLAMFHAGNDAGVGSGIYQIVQSKFCIFQ